MTFIQWYGAYAFADFYNVALPTEGAISSIFYILLVFSLIIFNKGGLLLFIYFTLLVFSV